MVQKHLMKQQFTTLMSDTGKKFDSSTVKFDGSGGDAVPRDTSGQYVDSDW